MQPGAAISLTAMTGRLTRVWIAGLLALAALAGTAAAAVNYGVPTDVKPPKTKLTYPVRQDFLAKKRVLVYLRSSEAATAESSGQLEFKKGKYTVIYGLYGSTRQVQRHEKATLRLRVPSATREAAERAIGNGRKVLVKVTVSATDAAGNESGKTVAVIKPPRH